MDNYINEVPYYSEWKPIDPKAEGDSKTVTRERVEIKLTKTKDEPNKSEITVRDEPKPI